MKPQPGPPIDRAAFEKLRRIAPNLLAAQCGKDGDWRAQPLPEELSFKLTNRCDLRCTHCYQWNESGYHHQLPESEKRGDLALGVIARTLEATKTLKSNVLPVGRRTIGLLGMGWIDGPARNRSAVDGFMHQRHADTEANRIVESNLQSP
jgi:hypothetical protein